MDDWGQEQDMIGMGSMQGDGFNGGYGGFGGGYGGGPQMVRSAPVFHKALFLFALVGAVIGVGLGVSIYFLMYNEDGNNILMVGTILGTIAACVLLACAICEMSKPRITVDHELGLSHLLFCLLGAVAVLGLGCLCEFLYEMDWGVSSTVFNDYIFVMDDSDSMEVSDPADLRYDALDRLLDSMDEDMRVGLVRFQHTVYRQPVELDYLDDAQRQRLMEEIQMPVSDGGTDFNGALQTALDLIRDSKEEERSPVVVLLSDGDDQNFSVDRAGRRFLNEGITISTIGLGGGANMSKLRRLAEDTGGQFFEVQDAGQLLDTFQKASAGGPLRCLFKPRPGVQRTIILYMALRILFLMLPGALIGFFILMLLRNGNAARQLLVSAVCGLLAGIVMEFGTFFLLPLAVVWPISWILYGIVLLNYVERHSGIGQRGLSETDFGPEDMSAFDAVISREESRSLSQGLQQQGGKIERGDSGDSGGWSGGWGAS